MAQSLFTSIAIRAKAVLKRSRIFDLRALVVEQEDDCVVLRGSVDSFYHKQLAQEIVRSAADGAEIANAVSVVYRPDEELDWRW